MTKKEEDKRKDAPTENSYSRQLEKQVAELQKEHEECIRLKNVEKFTAVSRMTRTVAHEIRNPLTNIGLALEQLNAELPPNDDVSLLVDMINRNTTRINTIITDLINSTKFAQLDFSEVSINELLDDVIGHVKHFADHKNALIDEDFTDPLPKLLIDKEKMKTAFENLLTNAIESIHSTEGKILITTANESHKCVVTIRHNGSSVEGEKLERLFEPYFLGKGTSGLALTHAQNTILNHGGNIYVESEHGKETVFTIILEFA